MAYEYLNNLGLSDEDKGKLKALGAATPAALLSRIQYSEKSREQFAAYVGGEGKVSAIESALQSLSSKDARSPLPPFKPGLGAMDTGQFSVATDSQSKQDALVVEIQKLRSEGADADAEEKASQLRQLLDQTQKSVG